jgi:hypothetical protein
MFDIFIMHRQHNHQHLQQSGRRCLRSSSFRSLCDFSRHAYIEKIKVDSVTWTRQMTTNNIKNFCENLDRVDWEFVNSLHTAKEKFEWFFENFLNIFYQCCPKKWQKINNNTENQLWFGKELERKRNVLEALDAVRKCTGSPQTKNLYNKLRIAYKASINQAKKNYYSNLIENSNNKSSRYGK